MITSTPVSMTLLFYHGDRGINVITVKPCLTATSVIWSSRYYGQFNLVACQWAKLNWSPMGQICLAHWWPYWPWTPEIFMECYCVARNKPIRHEITKLQTTTVIILWFWGLLACPELCCEWPEHNQLSLNFSGVHGFLSLTVTGFHCMLN